MTGHVPFDANSDWTNPYCGNSSNDPLVDKMIGNAYHVVRTIYCNLGNLKLIYDFLNQYGMVLGVKSEDELKALTTEAEFARIYGFDNANKRQVTDYLYVDGDRTGILPNDPTATGSWVVVATSNSGGGSDDGNAPSPYIPYVYNNGSAIGGETSIPVPVDTVGVPMVIIEGFTNTVGYGFEFDATTLTVTLAQPLEPGDEVVLLLTGTPAVPNNPNVSDWVQINWLYNGGYAVGDEQVIYIPYTFQSIPAIYKNGLRQYAGLSERSYTVDSPNQRILLTEPLITNDRVIVTIGGESTTLIMTDRTIQEIARVANVKDNEVILSTNTTQYLNNIKVLYDVVAQKSYGLPVLPTNIYINSVTNGQLTYSPGNITVDLLPVPGSAEELREDLGSNPGSELITYKSKLASSVARELSDKVSDMISVKDYGAKGDDATDDTSAFQAAIQAAKTTVYIGKGVFVPAAAYVVSGVILDAGLRIYGEGKSCSILRPKSDGDVCLVITTEMAMVERIEFRSYQGKTSLSTGISIEAPLVTISDCAFTFLKHGILTPSGKGAGELIIRHNRFAASGFGAALLGGNINTLFLQNTYNDCSIGLFSTDEAATGDVKKITEGITLNGDRFYTCGNAAADQAAIEVIGTRWLTLNSVMSDLAFGNALRITDVKHVRISDGYYSSNHSGNRSCVVIRGECDNFLMEGSMLSDSRYFCMEVEKYAGKTPDNFRISNIVFQLNDADPAQTGDLLVNSAKVVTTGCSFTSTKAGGITIIDNESGGSRVDSYQCSFKGGVQTGGVTCKFTSKNSPTHPDSQSGIATIASGQSTITVPLTTLSVPGANSIGIFHLNAVGKNEPVWGDVVSGGLQITQGSTNPTTICYTLQLVYS